MSSDIGNLTASIRRQVDEKTLHDGRQWARDIVAKHEAGTYRGGVYALKLALSVVDERAVLEKLRGGQNDIVEAK